jgi:hypothetical protein
LASYDKHGGNASYISQWHIDHHFPIGQRSFINAVFDGM